MESILVKVECNIYDIASTFFIFRKRGHMDEKTNTDITSGFTKQIGELLFGRVMGDVCGDQDERIF